MRLHAEEDEERDESPSQTGASHLIRLNTGDGDEEGV